MSRRLLLLISALGALLALPAFAGAAMVYQSSGAITTKWEVSTDENDADVTVTSRKAPNRTDTGAPVGAT